MRSVWPVLMLLLFAGLPVRAEIPVPMLAQRVTDLTGLLTQDQRTELEHRLARFESEKGSQIAVLLVPTTQPETIEQYSIRVADAWKLGRKGVDDGILVLVAQQDRALRIEVGRGLEGVVPDAIAKRVIEEIMLPRFKQGDLYGGLSAGIDRTIALVQGEPLPPPASVDRPPSDLLDVLLFALMGGIFGGQFLRGMFGPLPGGLVAGIGAGVLLGLFGVPIVLAVVFGAFVFAAVFAGIGRAWPRGYYGDSGGFGRGSGSGGFGGGGGGFSGGGASGRW
jgi:uncharacterized protein